MWEWSFSLPRAQWVRPSHWCSRWFNNLSTVSVPTRKQYLTHGQDILPTALISISFLGCERDALQPDVHSPWEALLTFLLGLNQATCQKPLTIPQGLDPSAPGNVRDHPLQPAPHLAIITEEEKAPRHVLGSS